MSQTQPTTAPKELVPSRIDRIAKETPEQVWGSFPIDDNDLSKGWKDLNFRGLSRTINRTCELLEPRIGRGDGNSTVAYVTSAVDPRPVVLAVALLKLGHVLLCSAPRNSLPMHLNLFEKTNCSILLHSDEIKVEDVRGNRPMKVFQMPSWAVLADQDGPEPQHYPYDKSYEAEKDKPIAIVHTSGSTGMPKPRHLSAQWLVTGVQTMYMPPVNGKRGLLSFASQPLRAYVGLPPWHAAGLAMSGFGASVFGKLTWVSGPANRPPFGAVAREVFKYANIRIALCNPTILMDLSKNEEDLKLWETFDMAMYGGGKLSALPISRSD